ncbi:MAG: hypothetical protein JWM68_4517 [Verrucomicrobiales bacterium]|nr:hypothetical protein [Verrucomicrobiales bacterium]
MCKRVFFVAMNIMLWIGSSAAVESAVKSQATNPAPMVRRLESIPSATTNATMSLMIGWEIGKGEPATSTKAQGLKPISLRFQNHDTKSQAVMPELDGSNVHWRYPFYDFEIVSPDGTVLQPKSGPRCGNVNPLRREDVVLLPKGEVFRTSVTPAGYQLPPGKYKVRVHYTARRNASIKGVPLGENDASALKAIQNVWEGTLVSNWIELEIVP